MTLVVDASVAIKWFVPEVHHEQAQALLYAHGGDLEAPDLLLVEVTNIAWKKLVRNEVGRDQARAIAAETRAFIVVSHASRDLVDQALEIAIALGHAVYDCLYLACALHADATLVTADEAFLRVVKGTDHEPRVRFVGDFSPEHGSFR